MLFFLSLLQNSHSVPLQLFQQGRLLANDGSTVDGLHVITFRLYNAETAGDILWEEPIAVTLSNGYYSVRLGSNTVGNPLDQDILIQYPLYLEIIVDNDSPLTPRQKLTSTPYAQIAGEAESIVGGQVNATEIQINGNLVVNSDGSWVGPTVNINWNDIQNIPAGFVDQIDNQLQESEVETFVTNGAIDLHETTTIGGLPILTSETDTLMDLSCINGDVPKFDTVTGWYCETDLVLSEEDVESYAFNEPVDLQDGSTMNGSELVTKSVSLSQRVCSDNEVLVYHLSSANWECGTDKNDTLTAAEVQAMVEAVSGLALAAGTTVDGSPVLTEASDLQWNKIQGAPSGFMTSCNDGEILQYDADSSDWVCANVFDQDNDGFFSWEDCDDNDSESLTKAADKDCDGVMTADDCDDNDTNSTIKADDADCDGTTSDYDCDDNDANSTIKVNDIDCDGIITNLDCDDTDANNTLLISQCFSTGTFTNCSQTGHTGPSQSQCDLTYANTDLEGDVIVTDGIQYWTVPITGTYTIDVQGAGGGTTNMGSGKGARMIGDFELEKGTILKILVGQRGGDSSQGNCDASAGGGTFVATEDNTPLIVAGGGGGGSHSGSGFHALTTETAHAGCGTAGTNGGGGSGSGCPDGAYGTGGGGFYSNGANSGWGGGAVSGGTAFVNGGNGAPAYDAAGSGGFGGGGVGHGNCYIGGPGGGGYSGGGAGSQGSGGTGGGGGGSYNSGSNQNNTTGVQANHGLVTITIQ